MPVINTIKQFIDERGITPYRFAQNAGISLNTAYALYNTPSQRVGAAVLDKICDAYKIQPSEILLWVDPDKTD